MRVKIGETYTTQASLRSIITYRCVNCGEKQVGEYKVESSGTAEANIFQNGKQISQMNQIKVIGALIEQNKRNREEVNVNHKYLCLTHPITCGKCETVQPWSDMTEHPWKVKVPEFVIVLGVILGVATLSCMINGIWELAGVFGLTIAAVAAFFIFLKKRYASVLQKNEATREEAIEKFLSGQTEFPMYYRREDIQELLKSPYSAEVLKKYPNLLDSKSGKVNWPK